MVKTISSTGVKEKIAKMISGGGELTPRHYRKSTTEEQTQTAENKLHQEAHHGTRHDDSSRKPGPVDINDAPHGIRLNGEPKKKPGRKRETETEKRETEKKRRSDKDVPHGMKKNGQPKKKPGPRTGKVTEGQ